MKGKFGFPVLIPLFGILIVAVIAVRYQDYIQNHNFTLNVNTGCDTATQSCFVSDCSPEDDPGCPPGPYEKIEIRAADAPKCLEEHTCENFTCGDIQSCSVTYCSEDALEDGESCSDAAPATTQDATTSPVTQ